MKWYHLLMLTVCSLVAQTNTNSSPQPGYHWEGSNQVLNRVLNAAIPALLLPDKVEHEIQLTTNDWTKDKSLAAPWIVGKQLHLIGYPMSNYLCLTMTGGKTFPNVEASSNIWMTMSNLPIVTHDLVYGTNNEVIGYKP